MKAFIMTDLQKDIVHAMADCNLNVTAAVKVINEKCGMTMTRSQLTGHIQVMDSMFCLDARKFWDLVKLLDLAKEDTDEEWRKRGYHIE